MTRAVIDASVAVKLLVDEDGADQAMIVYRTFELLAPELLLAECANIIWKKTRRGELTAPEAELAAGLLVDLFRHFVEIAFEASGQAKAGTTRTR